MSHITISAASAQKCFVFRVHLTSVSVEDSTPGHAGDELTRKPIDYRAWERRTLCVNFNEISMRTLFYSGDPSEHRPKPVDGQRQRRTIRSPPMQHRGRQLLRERSFYCIVVLFYCLIVCAIVDCAFVYVAVSQRQ